MSFKLPKKEKVRDIKSLPFMSEKILTARDADMLQKLDFEKSSNISQRLQK